MENIGVIKKVTEPARWVSSMIPVSKSNGEIRVCLDLRELNQAIQRQHYPMPSIEDVTARMPNAKVFSKFDATSGYWQLKLTDESSLLTTFNTPFGRYKYVSTGKICPKPVKDNGSSTRVDRERCCMVMGKPSGTSFPRGD